MTYLNFLIYFILPPTLIFGSGLLTSKSSFRKHHLLGTFLLCAVALLYTTPWDNYLVAHKVWWYGEDRVLGTLFYVPYEEYAFFVLQTLMTSFWSYFIFKKIHLKTPESFSYLVAKPIILVLAAVFLWSLYGLTQDSSFYMSLILSWSLPVILLQFTLGSSYLLYNFKAYLWALLPPSLYLWALDFFAISEKIWDISPLYTCGLKIGVLPLEEMLFFLVTNVMVVQGLLLFHTMKDKIKIRIFK